MGTVAILGTVNGAMLAAIDKLADEDGVLAASWKPRHEGDVCEPVEVLEAYPEQYAEYLESPEEDRPINPKARSISETLQLLNLLAGMVNSKETPPEGVEKSVLEMIFRARSKPYQKMQFFQRIITAFVSVETKNMKVSETRAFLNELAQSVGARQLAVYELYRP